MSYASDHIFGFPVDGSRIPMDIDEDFIFEERLEKLLNQYKDFESEEIIMNVTAKRTGTKVTTGKVRLSYAHIFEPHAMNDGQEAKYSVSVIIPKTDKETLKAIKEATDQAKKDGASKWGNKIPANLKTPLRDGDEERPDDEAYANNNISNDGCLQYL